MKVRFGSLPDDASGPPEAAGWQRLRGGPADPRLGAALIVLTALAVTCAQFTLLIGIAILAAPWAPPPPETYPPTPWLAIALTALLSIPAHELLHLLWHPGGGLSDRSLLVLWPAKLQFGVYYEGCMSRRRWLAMRAVPFLVLSALPTAALAALTNVPMDDTLRACLSILALVNSVGSAADLLAMIVVLRQVPPGGELNFQRGKAYWQASRSRRLPCK